MGDSEQDQDGQAVIVWPYRSEGVRPLVVAGGLEPAVLPRLLRGPVPGSRSLEAHGAGCGLGRSSRRLQESSRAAAAVPLWKSRSATARFGVNGPGPCG